MLKEMVTKLLEDVVRNIPGTSVVRQVMEDVLEMAWWRMKLNAVWSVLVDNKKMQRMVLWRVESQRMEEQFLMECMMKEERLARGRKRKNEILNSRMDVDVPEIEIDTDMDWMQDEKKEHVFLSEMLEMLELGFSQDVPMKDIDEEKECFDDILEHTILDQLLLEWDINTADTVVEKVMLAKTDDDAGCWP